jgi:hypothetical protein
VRFEPGLLWRAARDACVAWGGYLATVADGGENDFLRATFSGPSGTSPWIGGTDEVSEGSWRWVTGEAWAYQNWAGGEPNNSGDEDFLHIYPSGQWNDCRDACGALSYICERDTP